MGAQASNKINLQQQRSNNNKTHHAHIRTAISRRRRRSRQCRGQRSRRQFVVGVQTDANLGELWERKSETGWAAEKCRLGQFSLLWLSRNKWERAWSTFLPLSRPLSISLGRCRIFADAGQLLTVNALLALPPFFLGLVGCFLLYLFFGGFFGICNNYLKPRLIKSYCLYSRAVIKVQTIKHTDIRSYSGDSLNWIERRCRETFLKCYNI